MVMVSAFDCGLGVYFEVCLVVVIFVVLCWVGWVSGILVFAGWFVDCG